MALEDFVACSIGAEDIAETPFIDDALSCWVALEDGWCDPWFQNEPAADVDASDLLVAPGVAGWSTFVTVRCQ